MSRQEVALVELGQALRDVGYRFVTPTPETHRRVNMRTARAGEHAARDLRDVFGWSRPFRKSLLPSHWVALLEQAGACATKRSSCVPTSATPA